MRGVLIIFMKCSRSTRSGIDISGKFEFSFFFFFFFLYQGKMPRVKTKGTNAPLVRGMESV